MFQSLKRDNERSDRRRRRKAKACTMFQSLKRDNERSDPRGALRGSAAPDVSIPQAG